MPLITIDPLGTGDTLSEYLCDVPPACPYPGVVVIGRVATDRELIVCAQHAAEWLEHQKANSPEPS